MRFKLGQPVEFTGTVKKEYLDGRTFHVEGRLPRWGDTEYSQGIVVGRRNLMEYKTTTYSDYEDYTWESTSYTSTSPVTGTSKTAWLIAFDMRSRPVMVLDSQIKAMEEGE